MASRTNFGLWLAEYNDTSMWAVYRPIRQLSRLFDKACSLCGVDKSAFPTPDLFQQHLVENAASDKVLEAFSIARKEWTRTTGQVPFYTNREFDNWP
jgi:hypothetical protein